MGPFLFGKKKEQVSVDVKNTNFIVLGACCKKSSDTFENVKQAVKELGLNDEVINVGDAKTIAQYGVLQTPALVVHQKVVSYGKLITKEEAISLINQQIGSCCE